MELRCEEKYKGLDHFITVGPKSCYIEKDNVEVFDPYVISQVKNLSFKNIKINGKIVDDLKDYIKEINFDRIYDSNYATGYGVVDSIIKL